MSKLGEQIINYLKDYAEYPLPDFGVIAGQSVAEAYFRLKNIPIHTRIKDIDIFFNSKYREKLDPEGVFSRQYKQRGLLSEKRTLIKADKHQSSFVEETISVFREESPIYTILDVFNIENINVVNVEYTEHSGTLIRKNFVKQTLEGFDINAIEIGVDLKTKRVYMTPAFKAFTKHRQVQITRYLKPMRTLCRFLEKSQYYKGAYFDIPYEINLFLAFFKRAEYIDRGGRAGTRILFENYDKLNEKNKKLMSKYFHVERQDFDTLNLCFIPHSKKIAKKKKFDYFFVNECPWHQDDKTNAKIHKFYKNAVYNDENIEIINPAFDYLHPKPVSISAIAKSEGYPYKEICEKLFAYREGRGENVVTQKVNKFRTRTIASHLKNYSIFLSSKSVEIVSFSPKMRAFHPVFKKNLRLFSSNKKNRKECSPMFSDRGFLDCLYSKNKAALISKNMKEDENYLLFFRAALDAGADVSTILQLKKNDMKAMLRHFDLTKKLILFHSLKEKRLIDFGEYSRCLLSHEKSKNSYFIGNIESDALPLHFIYKSLDKADELLQKLAKMNKLSVIEINKEFLSRENYKINHINNVVDLRRVGDEMHHCVGGYGQKLLTQSMLFFDIYDIKKKRYTLSVNKRTKYDEAVDKVNVLLHIDQMKMRFNTRPPSKAMKDIQQFVETLQARLNSD